MNIQFRNCPKSTLPTRVGWTPHWKLVFWRLPAIFLVIFTWTDLFHKSVEHVSTMFVWNPANPQRRSRQWWFFDLGMGATPPHTGRLIPYEGRLIRGWCHHYPKSLLKMNRNEGCLIWGWGHTWWGRAHTWWLLARPLWSCAHTPIRPCSSLREWGSAHQGKGSHWSRCLAKAYIFFHEGCPKVSVCVIPQLGSDCLNITNAPQWLYRSKTFLTALCWQPNCNS